MLTALKRATKHFLRRHEIYVYRRIPRGMDLAVDLASVLDVNAASVVFDVGANIGQSSVEYLDQFPKAHIYAFEPASENFGSLEARFRRNCRVSALKMALGEDAGELLLALESDATMHHITLSAPPFPGAVEKVNVDTVDSFSERTGVAAIDFLKIDTEGHDLSVLRGAARMLEDGLIHAVQCECGMHPENTHHVPFEDIKFFLEQRGYRTFGIYEQVNEWTTNSPYLRRINAVFVNGSKAR